MYYTYNWFYETIVVPLISTKYKITNLFGIPKLKEIEIVVNCKTKGMAENELLIILKELYLLTGQRPLLLLNNASNLRKANYLIKLNLRQLRSKHLFFLLVTYVLPNLIKKNKVKFHPTKNNSIVSFTINDINLLKRTNFIELKNKFNIVFLVKLNTSTKAHKLVNKFFFQMFSITF